MAGYEFKSNVNNLNKWSIFFLGGGGCSPTHIFLHTSFSKGQIRLYPEFHFPKLLSWYFPGWVGAGWVDGCWVLGVGNHDYITNSAQLGLASLFELSLAIIVFLLNYIDNLEYFKIYIIIYKTVGILNISYNFELHQKDWQ